MCKIFCFSAALRTQGFKAQGRISQKVRQESLHCRPLTRRNKRAFRKMCLKLLVKRTKYLSMTITKTFLIAMSSCLETLIEFLNVFFTLKKITNIFCNIELNKQLPRIYVYVQFFCN